MVKNVFFENSRNDLIKILDILGNNKNGSIPYIGRLKKSYRYNKIIGRQSFDGKTYWRLDYDENKVVHFNIKDYSNGKGKNSIKIAIPTDIDEEQYKKL